jgi:hypothetical protein
MPIYTPWDFILRRTDAEIKNIKKERLQAATGGRLEGEPLLESP